MNIYTQKMLIIKFPLLLLLVDGRDTLELNKLQKFHLRVGDLRRTFLPLYTSLLPRWHRRSVKIAT